MENKREEQGIDKNNGIKGRTSARDIRKLITGLRTAKMIEGPFFTNT
jgi:hypothetical protein